MERRRETHGCGAARAPCAAVEDMWTSDESEGEVRLADGSQPGGARREAGCLCVGRVAAAVGCLLALAHSRGVALRALVQGFCFDCRQVASDSEAVPFYVSKET